MRMAGRTGTALRRAAATLLLAGTIAAAAGDRAAAQVYGVALPDISNKRLNVQPKSVPAGGTVEIFSMVQNLGAGPMTPAHGAPDAPATLTIRFLLVRNLKDKTGLDAGSWTVNALERRETARHTALWTVPATLEPAMYFLCADVDPDNQVRESNELNNRNCLPLTVKPAVPAPEPRLPEDGEDGDGEDGDPLPEPEPVPPLPDSAPGGTEDDGGDPGFSGPGG
jgi:hypothetical protein